MAVEKTHCPLLLVRTWPPLPFGWRSGSNHSVDLDTLKLQLSFPRLMELFLGLGDSWREHGQHSRAEESTPAEEERPEQEGWQWRW